MDDFGTGLSSLSCLHQLPIDALKIDRSFISNMTGQPRFAALVLAVLTLAQNLKIRVIAEGVESAEQLALLLALGCDCVQGYHISNSLIGRRGGTALTGRHPLAEGRLSALYRHPRVARRRRRRVNSAPHAAGRSDVTTPDALSIRALKFDYGPRRPVRPGRGHPEPRRPPGRADAPHRRLRPRQERTLPPLIAGLLDPAQGHVSVGEYRHPLPPRRWPATSTAASPSA